MYPVLPLETSQYATEVLLILFTAVSTVMSMVFCTR
jgi:hypothetical protein